MKIEIRNVKYAAFASQETNCFSAAIYIDGVKTGTVSNEGYGGPDMFHPHEVQTRIDAYAATLPEVSLADIGVEGTMKQSAEIIIGELMNDWLVDRDIKRMTKAKVVYAKPGKKGLWNWGLVDRAAHAALVAQGDAAVRAKMVAQNIEAGDILNFLPIEQARDVLRANAR